jgi:hypothetical protein
MWKRFCGDANNDDEALPNVFEVFGGDPKQGEGVFLSIGIRKPQEFRKETVKDDGKALSEVACETWAEKENKNGTSKIWDWRLAFGDWHYQQSVLKVPEEVRRLLLETALWYDTKCKYKWELFFGSWILNR